ncbi:MAG: replication initiator protein [Microviridae sp.]|nr:MAG: replication initiator protein [Microviridae sp.]
MPCYHPITGYYSKKPNPLTGKHPLVFSQDNCLVPIPQVVPCGRCIGCRLERSKQWATRCLHEASLHTSNCFLTLTFDDAHLPSDGSLNVSDFQKFMKRLRKFLSPKQVRFFHCGEYGAKFKRPHHHVILFGHDFDDKVQWKDNNGVKTYLSESLIKLWPSGFSTVSDVNYASIAYVSRYVLKKFSIYQTNSPSDNSLLSVSQQKKLHYGDLHPEYVTMSRNPGIGSKWYDQFKTDIYPAGFCVLDGGIKARSPIFYDRKYELEFPLDYAMLQIERSKKASLHDNSRARLLDKEEIVLHNISTKQRGFENGD